MALWLVIRGFGRPPGRTADAFDIAFWWSVGFSAVAVLLSLWLPGRPAH